MNTEILDKYVLDNFRLFSKKEIAKKMNVNYSDVYNSMCRQKLRNTTQEITRKQSSKYCALGDSLRARKIISTISDISSISIEDIKGNRRFREFVNPRFFAIQLIKEFTNLSLKAIGREFNNRDHTTIMHALKTISDISDTDEI